MTMMALLLQPLLLILCNVPRILDDTVIFEQYVMLIECIHAYIFYLFSFTQIEIECNIQWSPPI
jgi:hypothetical protein